MKDQDITNAGLEADFIDSGGPERVKREKEKADADEPESGFIAAGLPRILGVSDNKPEPWFEKGGYTQEDFPQADTIYDEKDKKTPIYQVIKKIANTEEKYDTFQKDVAGWDKYGDKDYSTQFEE